MTKLLFFNGPPSCGKDTAARFLEWKYHWGFDRFAMPIKRAFAGAVSAPIDKYGNVAGYEHRKEEPLALLGGKTYRQWQIDFSENFMKPNYGDDVFGRLFVERNGEGNIVSPAIVVPDSGFAVEANYIADAFGPENVVLVRVHRPGYDFKGDSRSYLSGVPVAWEHDVQNDGDVDWLYEQVNSIATQFVHD